VFHGTEVALSGAAQQALQNPSARFVSTESQDRRSNGVCDLQLKKDEDFVLRKRFNRQTRAAAISSIEILENTPFCADSTTLAPLHCPLTQRTDGARKGQSEKGVNGNRL
jgi:hypothetical protein